MSAAESLSLMDIVDMIEHEAQSDNPSKCIDLISAHLLEAWFGMPPQRLALLLKHSIARGGDASGAGRLILGFMGGAISTRSIASNTSSRLPGPLKGLGVLGLGIYLRQLGKTRESFESLIRVESQYSLPTLYGATADLSQLISVQSGISGLLAGKLNEALESFNRARLHPASTTLSFLRRDATAKASLVHALFGDAERAKTLHQEASNTKRSMSWVEDIIDTSLLLTEVSLNRRSPIAAKRLLDAIPPETIGELWPYYVLVTHRVYERAGDRTTGRVVLENYQQYGWPCIPGDGLNGSAFQIALASLALNNGDVSGARALIDTADPRILPVQLTRMVYELARGEPEKVLNIGSHISECTKPLRLLNLSRVLLEAAAMHAKGDLGSTMTLLDSLDNANEALTIFECKLVPSQLWSLVKERFPLWVSDTNRTSALLNTDSLPTVSLTSRELQALQLIANGLSRDEAASRMWVTLATLKSHLHSCFQKLKVTTKDQALEQARRRGIL